MKKTTKALAKIEPKPAEAVAAEKAKAATALQTTASKMVIANQGDFQKGGLFIAALKKERDAVEVKRREITKPLDDAKAKVMALFKPVIAQLGQAITCVDAKMIEYAAAQEALARKEAEKKAKRFEKTNPQLAEDVRQAAVEEATPQATGTQILSFWHAECENLQALVQAVAAGKAPLECLQADEVYLNKLARLHQDNAKAPPGVKFVEVRKTGRVGGGGSTNV
jgi:hypothetical protein